MNKSEKPLTNVPSTPSASQPTSIPDSGGNMGVTRPPKLPTTPPKK